MEGANKKRRGADELKQGGERGGSGGGRGTQRGEEEKGEGVSRRR